MTAGSSFHSDLTGNLPVGGDNPLTVLSWKIEHFLPECLLTVVGQLLEVLRHGQSMKKCICLEMERGERKEHS